MEVEKEIRINERGKYFEEKRETLKKGENGKK